MPAMILTQSFKKLLEKCRNGKQLKELKPSPLTPGHFTLEPLTIKMQLIGFDPKAKRMELRGRLIYKLQFRPEPYRHWEVTATDHSAGVTSTLPITNAAGIRHFIVANEYAGKLL